MKRFSMIVALAVFAAFIAMAATPPQATAGPIKLSYANFPPAPTFPCKQMERWKAEVEKRTNGQVQIQTYPGGTLLGAKEMMDGVIAGQADIGNLCQAYQPGRFVLSNATALPLGIPNARVGSLVLWELYNKYKFKPFDKVKVLTMFATAPSNIMSKKAIRSLDDIKGVDLRASGGAARILKAWGANQVGMPMSAVPEALQKGTVQGLFTSMDVLKDFKFAEITKFVTVTNTVIYPFAVVMNLDSWNALPDGVKKVMDELGKEQAEWTGKYLDEHIAKGVAWSKKEKGVEFISLSAAEKAKWDAALQSIVDDWVKKKGAKYPAEAVVADIKAMVAKYSK